MVNKKMTTRLLRIVLRSIVHEKDTTVTAIYKTTDFTHSHVYNTVVKLNKEGIVSSRKVGRANLINITDKGKALLNCLDQLNQIYKEIL